MNSRQKSLLYLLIVATIILCNNNTTKAQTNSFNLNITQAHNLSKLPLHCISTEYPNKLGQVIADDSDLQPPHLLHPSFFGCFDWHSSVHGHWSLVKLCKTHPNLENKKDILKAISLSLSKQNIEKEVEYFNGKQNASYERTYGWAWLLKLSEELHTWNTPIARELETNLKPLTDLLCERYIEFLNKLVYPIRVGEHTNTAFGLTMAWDYAQTTNNAELLDVIEIKTREFYWNDEDCPLSWEPSGYDFLSPCLEEIDLMRRVLAEKEFRKWMKLFAPKLKSKKFVLEPGKVGDRSDGKLVHLDGLNFSRAWVFYNLANNFEEYSHLREIADIHLKQAIPNVIGDSYEGSHWLGTFAIYALDCKNK